jgi:hypothetical protein
MRRFLTRSWLFAYAALAIRYYLVGDSLAVWWLVAGMCMVLVGSWRPKWLIENQKDITELARESKDK